MANRARPIDWLRIGWLSTVLIGGLLLLYWIGIDGLINHGDTGFPLNAVQRFLDVIWAWNPRLNFGVPQYLAHSTLPFDAVRAIPALSGLSPITQSQLYFVLTFMLVAAAAERFATVGLGLKQPLARIAAMIVLTINQFNMTQLLGGQGLQLIEYAALLASTTAFLGFVRGKHSQLGWYTLWSMFVGSVFFPFLALLITTIIATRPRQEWFRLIAVSLLAVVANLFWMIPIIARTLSAPIVSEIFQAGSDTAVLDGSRPFTGLNWVLRLAYGNYPVPTRFVLFLASPAGLAVGLIPVATALALAWRALILRQQSRLLIPFLVSWLICILLATGIHYDSFAPIYYWFFKHIPLFQAYRVPAKWLLPTMIGQAAVLGLGLEWWLKNRPTLIKSWAATTVIGALLLIGGITQGRSIANDIDLAHYPADYFTTTAPAGRWLELLPAATIGGYVPTQDLPTQVVRTYTPSGQWFDAQVAQAVTNGKTADFFAARGLTGWLLHQDIPMADALTQAIGPAQRPLEFRLLDQSAAPAVSVITNPIMTNAASLTAMALIPAPIVPYITVTTLDDLPVPHETVWQLLADSSERSVSDQPLRLSESSITGKFRLIGTYSPGTHQPSLTVRAGTTTVTTNVVGSTNHFVSEPFNLTSGDQLELATTPTPLKLEPFEFTTVRFTPAGPVVISEARGTETALACHHESLATTAIKTGLDLSQTYVVNYQATTSGVATAHVAIEWLDKTGVAISLVQTAPGMVIHPLTTTARLYWYCEAATGEGSVRYWAIRLEPGVGVSNVYTVPVTYPTVTTTETAVTFTQTSRVQYQLSAVPASGVLILREHDDPWWEAVDNHGQRLKRVGRAYNLFPAWELNGSPTVTIRFLGQQYFLWGIGLSLLAWVGLLAIMIQSRCHD